MGADLSILKGEYLSDLLAQPQALDDTCNSLEVSKSVSAIAAGLQRGKFRRVVLTGMGSSFHALHPLNLQLIAQGHTAVMVETSELIHYQRQLLDSRTLIVAVSQSGRSIEIVRLLKSNRGRATVIAVTNTADSPLYRQSDAVFLTHAGAEFSVSCKTYVSSLIALKFLGDVLCDRDASRSRKELRHAAPSVALYLADWRSHVEFLIERLKSIRDLFLIGRGASLAAAGTGALIIKESTHRHAEGMGAAAFRHGPFEMLGDAVLVLVFSGDRRTKKLNRGLLDDIREQGGQAELVGDKASISLFHLPDDAPGVLPVLEILPVQMMTLALAALAGREPGRFERTAKITTKE
ncbi:MAG TPA: SIS domain-containing protein [Terriglobales bacterium]